MTNVQTSPPFNLGPEASVENRIAALVDYLLEAAPPPTTPALTFLGLQFDLGLAWVHYPVGQGGLGVDRKHQSSIDARLRTSDAPAPLHSQVIGTTLAAPVLVAHASDDQKQRYLRQIFTGEEIWCQLFSEPGAGSDIAGLATTAVRDGDEWVINGQKVWTSFAHLATRGLLVTRTDPSVPKHRGMTYFVLDMRQPGVEVRPLRQMDGDAQFNEVFLSDARVHDSERLGEAGGGWSVVLSTLMNEREAIGEAADGVIDGALQVWRANPVGRPVDRDRLVRLWADSECVRLTALRALAQSRVGNPGPEAAVLKLAFSALNQSVTNFCVDHLGPAGMLYSDYTMRRTSGTEEASDPQRAFLRARGNSIEGGTSEILRNILAERVLGLPGEPRNDRDVAWRDVPKP